jgi:hypothetical protein
MKQANLMNGSGTKVFLVLDKRIGKVVELLIMTIAGRSNNLF